MATKTLKHVEDDEHYLHDWEEIQDKLDELRRKHNNLIRFLSKEYHLVKTELDELWVEFEEV